MGEAPYFALGLFLQIRNVKKAESTNKLHFNESTVSIEPVSMPVSTFWPVSTLIIPEASSAIYHLYLHCNSSVGDDEDGVGCHD